MGENTKKTSDKNKNRTFYVLAGHDQTKSRNVKFQDFVRLSERSVHKFTISIFFYDRAWKLILRESDIPKSKSLKIKISTN